MVESTTLTPFIQDRLDLVRTILEKAKTEKTALEDPSRDRKVWTCKKDDNPFIVHLCTFPDLKPEDFKKFTTDYIQSAKDIIAKEKNAPKITYEPMADVDGRPLVFQTFTPPVPMVST